MSEEKVPTIDWIRSSKQANGVLTLTLNLPDMPVTIQGGSEDYVYRRNWFVPFGGESLYIRSVSTFIGLDRGDLAEVDIELEMDKKGGPRVYRRSFHRHDGYSSFESWHYKDIDARTLGLAVSLCGRCCGVNKESGNLVCRAHYGIIVEAVAS